MTLIPEFLPVGSIVQTIDGTPIKIEFNDLINLTELPEWFNENFKPIPLTEKILTEWCNAECYEFDNGEPNQYRLQSKLIVIRDGKFVDYGSSVQLDYMHELQLLFLGLKTVLPITIK